MRRRIAEAEVGDDVFREDPTVEALQREAARRFGVEAALFVPTGTMANQIAVKALTQPGEEVLCEASSHVYLNEAGGLGLISGVQVRALPGERGLVDVALLQASIRGADIHHPRTALICLENTHNSSGGRVLDLDAMRAVRDLALRNGLFVHLDGARLFNASIASGVPVAAYAAQADLITTCLSKGLCCPAGSLVLGSRTRIEQCRRIRKALGGGMRQAGVLAAAGLFALQHLVERLADDHRRARELAQGLADVAGCAVDAAAVETNIVRVERPAGDAQRFCAELARRGVLALPLGPRVVRFVTHRDVGDEDVARALASARSIEGGADVGLQGVRPPGHVPGRDR